jgi:predicted nucleic acid-binding protein
VSIVCNASPLINLARIDKLDLLRQLYGRLLVPEAVWQEVVIQGAGQPGATQVETATWIQRAQVQNRALVQSLCQDLDAGEAESIALALEAKAQLLLMDERLGRETARHLGLQYVGLIGVLIEAKHKGLIDQVGPLLVALRAQAGFHISKVLYERILKDEAEANSQS